MEEEKDKPRHAIKDGRVVDYFQKGLFRKGKNGRARVGLLSPDGKWVFIEHGTKGQLLDESMVDEPEAYTIQSADDRAYARPRHPAKVFRKGKPNGFSQPLPFLYTISLQLPAPLKEGARYTIRFVGVNTSQRDSCLRSQASPNAEHRASMPSRPVIAPTIPTSEPICLFGWAWTRTGKAAVARTTPTRSNWSTPPARPCSPVSPDS